MAASPEAAPAQDSDTLLSIANCLFMRYLCRANQLSGQGVVSDIPARLPAYSGLLRFASITYNTALPKAVTELKLEVDGMAIMAGISPNTSFEGDEFVKDIVEVVANYALDEGLICSRGLFYEPGTQLPIDQETLDFDAELRAERFDIDRQFAAQS